MRTSGRKRYKLIYNPKAGDTTFKNRLDLVIEKFQWAGIQVVPYRTYSGEDVERAIEEMEIGEYQGIMVSGGDGTLNSAVNGIVKKELDIPLGIFPSGTANDFATNLKIPRNLAEACDLIIENKTKAVDIGQVGDKFFINVLSGGLISEIAHTVDINLKHAFGKIAYYLKGVGQLPKFKPFLLEIKLKESTFKGDVFLFLVLNSGVAGGFRKIAPKAMIDDGVFDVLVVKKSTLPEFAALFVKVLQGEHTNALQVEYFQTNELEIYSENLDTVELDGELGPKVPLKIKVVPKKLKVWVP